MKRILDGDLVIRICSPLLNDVSRVPFNDVQENEEERDTYTHSENMRNIFPFATAHLCFQLQMSWKLGLARSQTAKHIGGECGQTRGGGESAHVQI